MKDHSEAHKQGRIMYYVLESELLELVTHLVYQKDDGFGLSFLKGGILPQNITSGDLYVEVESNAVDLPDYLEVDSVPLVNQKFLNVLIDSGVNNYQSFPVEVRFEDSVVKDRFIINVVGRIQCVDMDNTDFSKFGPVIARIFSLKLNLPDGVPDIFRADEYQDIIFISEKLKDKIMENMITGCELRQADGWNDAHRF